MIAFLKQETDDKLLENFPKALTHYYETKQYLQKWTMRKWPKINKLNNQQLIQDKTLAVEYTETQGQHLKWVIKQKNFLKPVERTLFIWGSGQLTVSHEASF